MTANQFTRQWAIRLPNGDLYSHPKTAEPVEDYSVLSPMRDMWSFMGLTTTPTSTPAKSGAVVFDSKEAAEKTWGELTKQAEAVGVTLWGGVVVSRLCTPFTSGDPSVDFAQAVVAWVAENGSRS